MTFSNNLVVGPQIPGDTTASAWVAQIDGASNNGDWLWAKTAGSDTDDDDRTNDICADGFGNVYAIGFFEDLADFDGTILDATGRKKDIFVWKMSMTPGSFTYNNTFDTVYTADSMVFNPSDTGIFTNTGFIIDGCDTSFVDSVVHQKLGIQIIYDINNVGSATVTIDGVVQALPYSQNYWYGENITLQAQLNPTWLFSQWQSNTNPILPSNTSLTVNFNAVSSDSVILITYPKPDLVAFISGNDTICDNLDQKAEVKISFSGSVSPNTFVYSHNGVNKSPITTNLNPYIISTYESGVYDLVSFSDANEVGWFSGSALVTVLKAPEALFSLISDTLSIIYPNAQFTDNSIIGTANISEWTWSFGDNSFDENVQNPEHVFESETGIFEVSLIIKDNVGCTDTTFKHIWITDEYWMYVPNSFTPDNDQINDVFCISYNGIRTETFLFTVYNRVSEVVFSTSVITEIECFLNDNGWDGKHQTSGKELPMGMYVYEIYFQDFEGWKHQDFGNIYIIR
jgi:gliding motility-associated-like protein